MNETTFEYQDVESLRSKLYEVANEHNGDLLHPNVIQASQRLDAAITAVMRIDRHSTALSLAM